MPYLDDAAKDAALDWCRTNGTHISLCSSEPGSYGAISAVELGEATITIGANADHSTLGRQAQVPATTGETVDTNGTGTAFAVHNNTDTLVAAETASASKAVTTADTWGSAAFNIRVLDPT